MIDGLAYLRHRDRNAWICTACEREFDDIGGPPKCPCRDEWKADIKRQVDDMCRPFREAMDRAFREALFYGTGTFGQFGQSYADMLRQMYQQSLGQQNCQQQTPTAPPPAPDTIPEIPVAEPPTEELTPIPQRRVRRCYSCGRDPIDYPAVSRAKGEPAYCEEHRKK